MHTTLNTDFLTRTDLWTTQLKEILQDELMAMQYVNWMTEFPDGDTFHIPSIGEGQTDNYVEDSEITYRPLDTGEFTFQINEYISSGNYITKKLMQDAFYANQLMSQFVPTQERAIMEHVESKVLGLQGEQTAANANTINNRAHRYAAGGTSGVLELSDFAYANLALNDANVPVSGRVAIVSPATAYYLETLSDLVSVANNPRWEGIVSEGISTGMRFVKNVYGWDVYMSQRLATIGTETLNDKEGNAVNCAGFKANMFFSTDTPQGTFIGAWRQMPEVDSEWEMDRQRWKIATTARYDTALFRPEGLIVIPGTDTV